MEERKNEATVSKINYRRSKLKAERKKIRRKGRTRDKTVKSRRKWEGIKTAIGGRRKLLKREDKITKE